MGESIYVAFAVSVLRTALIAGGGWLVSRGLVEDGLLQEVAAGLALLVVTQAWGFWRIHRRVLIGRWMLLLGLESPPETAPEVIRAEAKARYRDGWIPPDQTDARTQDF